MLEFILDLVFDILFEGAAYIYESKKIVPLPIRIICGIIVALLYVGFGGVCMYMGIISIIDNQMIPALLFLTLGLCVLIGGFLQIRNQRNKRNA